MSSVAYPHVEIRSDGHPVVAGTGHKVRLLAEAHLEGMSVENLLQAYPHLTAADVHCALAYYYDHKESMDRQINEGRRLAEHMRERDKDSSVQRKMRELGW